MLSADPTVEVGLPGDEGSLLKLRSVLIGANLASISEGCTLSTIKIKLLFTTSLGLTIRS